MAIFARVKATEPDSYRTAPAAVDASNLLAGCARQPPHVLEWGHTPPGAIPFDFPLRGCPLHQTNPLLRLLLSSALGQ